VRTRPPPTPGPGLFERLLRAAARRAGRGRRSVMSLVRVVAAIYGGVRLCAAPPMLRQLDALEARVERGWDRLQRHTGLR
jgi:hypothetical protein